MDFQHGRDWLALWKNRQVGLWSVLRERLPMEDYIMTEKYRYYALGQNEGVEEEIKARSHAEAIRIAWRRAVHHLCDKGGAGQVTMEYVERVSYFEALEKEVLK